MKTYDFLFAGGGCAGLSLAYHLHLGGLTGKSVLIVDPEVKVKNDRTWCFWEDRPTPYDDWCEKTWNHLTFQDYKGVVQSPLGDYTYRLLRGVDFYQGVHTALAQNSCFEFRKDLVEDVGEDAQGPFARINGEMIRARYIFDSRYRWQQAFESIPKGYYALKQHFLGWRIRAEQPVFDPGKATIMDFRSPQPGHTRFFYILPFNEREALVEFTIFSADLLTRETYGEELANYIADTLGIPAYEVLEEEFGVIPMTDVPLETNPSPGVFRIGSAAGAVKASTGYAFLAIQQQAQSYATDILNTGQPKALSPSPSRFRIYDTLLLHLLTSRGELTAWLFGKLFRRNPMPLILKFLGERTRPLEEVRIMGLMPWPPFLMAIFVYVLSGRVFRSAHHRTHPPSHGNPVPQFVSTTDR